MPTRDDFQNFGYVLLLLRVGKQILTSNVLNSIDTDVVTDKSHQITKVTELRNFYTCKR